MWVRSIAGVANWQPAKSMLAILILGPSKICITTLVSPGLPPSISSTSARS